MRCMIQQSQNPNSTDQCLAFKHRCSTIEHKDWLHVIEQQLTDATKHPNKMSIWQRVAMAIPHAFV